MRYFKFVRFETLFLLIILIFASLLYFSKLNSIPSGLYVDEALSGYNAYSILKTGKDEYGKVLPLAFKFFGTYSPPQYVYLTALAVKIFGLSLFSTRFVSALSGVLSVLGIYLLIKELKIYKNKYIPIIVIFLYSISPWVVFFSRIGYEILLSYTIFIFGLYFIWKSLSNNKYFVPGVLLLSLATYASFTERFLAPFFIALFLLIFRKKLINTKYLKIIIFGLVLVLISQIPNLYLLTTPSFFTKSSLIKFNIVSRSAKKMIFLPKFISDILAVIREYFSQYVTFFSPKSLFFNPDPDPQRSLPELSVFYFWMALPYVVGIYSLLKSKLTDSRKFLLLIFLLSPVMAVLTSDPFSTQRVLLFLSSVLIVIGLGLDWFIEKINVKTFFSSLIVLIAMSLVLLWRSYFVLFPAERARDWSFGYQQLAEEISRNSEKTFIIDETRLKPSYIELLFFLKYPPDKYQKEEALVDIEKNYYYDTQFVSGKKFGNVEIRNIDWESDPCGKYVLVGDSLAISNSQAVEHHLEHYFDIRDNYGNIVFTAYETHPGAKCI